MPRAPKSEPAARSRPVDSAAPHDGPSGRRTPAAPPAEKRGEGRAVKLTDYRAEFKFPGVPVYQLKVRDRSDRGAGVVVRADSDFLGMIAVGQELSVKLLPPRHAGPSGVFRCRIEHISALDTGRFKGHMVVGMSIAGPVALS